MHHTSTPYLIAKVIVLNKNRLKDIAQIVAKAPTAQWIAHPKSVIITKERRINSTYDGGFNSSDSVSLSKFLKGSEVNEIRQGNGVTYFVLDRLAGNGFGLAYYPLSVDGVSELPKDIFDITKSRKLSSNWILIWFT